MTRIARTNAFAVMTVAATALSCRADGDPHSLLGEPFDSRQMMVDEWHAALEKLRSDP